MSSDPLTDQREIMAVSLARLLRDGETVFHGVASPLPMVSILLAKVLHAPNLVYLNITGSTDPTPTRFPFQRSILVCFAARGRW